MTRLEFDTVHGALNILVIEDSVDLAEAMAELLREAGHRVTVRDEEDGRSIDALVAYVTEERFDALLVDLGLSDMDGAALVEALSVEPNPAPIILCTGAAADRIDHLRPKVAIVLTKPFAFDALLESVAQIRRR